MAISCKMNYSQTIAELYSHESKGWQLGLENINGLLQKIGSPHKNLKTVHVAGTNGKGSVCAFISSILQHAGFKIGLYTSPHLIRFNERFRVNNKEISDKEIIELYARVKPHIKQHTFFEITTAMAFLYFKKKNIDFLVLEVGLGGRLDATNVVMPLVSVITNISLEHKDYLGDTIEKIAYEKAGIIKENIPVVTGCNGIALQVIKNIAREKNAHVYVAKKIVKDKPRKPALMGDFQSENTSVAITTINILSSLYGIKITPNAIKNGLANVKWPGRFEFVRRNILVDCAHNPDGITALSKELKKLKYKKRYERLILILGILKDKDFKKMLDIITPYADVIILTKVNSQRTAEPEELGLYIKKQLKRKFTITPNIKDALKVAGQIADKDDIILITGSIYLVGEAMQVIDNPQIKK